MEGDDAGAELRAPKNASAPVGRGGGRAAPQTGLPRRASEPGPGGAVRLRYRKGTGSTNRSKSIDSTEDSSEQR